MLLFALTQLSFSFIWK